MKKRLLFLMLFLMIVIFSACANSENDSSDSSEPPTGTNGDDAKEMTSFVFTADANDLLDGDIECEISGTDITGTLPQGPDLTALVATFSTTGVSVTINDVVQASGDSTNDFSSAVEYTVTDDDNSTKVYTVTVDKKAYSGEQTQIAYASDAEVYDELGWSVAISGKYAIATARAADDGVVDRTGAAYIYELGSDGTWTETAKLLASDRQRNDRFGSISISGNYAIIGSNAEDGGDGDPFRSAGAAYIFERNTDSTWTEKAILHASDMQESDYFGTSVSIYGDYALVGAPGEDGGGDLTADGGFSKAGAAYIFERIDGNWTERAILHASDMQGGDRFGDSVSIFGDYALVGASKKNDENGDGFGAGVAYIFERGTDGIWTEKAILQASDSQDNDRFGISVSIFGDYAIIGAKGESDEDVNNIGAGAAYIFERETDGTWTEKAILQASDRQDNDEFGTSVSIYGDYALVGAHLENGGGDLTSGDGFSLAGAAYLFERGSDGTWSEKSIIHASDMQEDDYFGGSVAIGSDSMIVGAAREDGGFDDPIDSGGAVYFFK